MPFSNGFSTGFAGVGLDEGTLQHLEAVAEQLGWRWWEFHEWPGSIAPGTVGMTARVAAPGLDESGQRDRWEVHVVWSAKEPRRALTGATLTTSAARPSCDLRWRQERARGRHGAHRPEVVPATHQGGGAAVGSKTEPAYVGWVITVEEA